MLNVKQRKAAIIGSGFSSLSVAAYLAKAGLDVTVYEKNPTIGGRATKFEAGGFTFDMGPSWYWMPDVFESFFNDFGRSDPSVAPEGHENLFILIPLAPNLTEKPETIETAAFLLLLHLAGVRYLSRFYFAYIIILIPFFCVNGILTGTLLEEQVVWYNNSENLGFRLGTIPVEDVFYGLLLILMNVTFYEAIIHFRTARAKSQSISRWNLGRFYGR